MFVKRRSYGWVVTEFNDNHNHPLVPKWSLTRYLRSHKNIPEDEVDFLRLLHSCNLETSRQMQIMGSLYGSIEHMTYGPKEVANLRASFRREDRYTDMQGTLEYFMQLKQEDKDFFCKFLMDEENRVECMFWIDGPSRRAYKFYNDCLSFDTTYCTNIYKMPCAPFIGINCHGQSIQFGCGFLRNELTDSFIWLFETFLEAMDGLAPLNIITDQDFAMRAGIDKVFPHARHRNCRLHIVRKAQEVIGPLMSRNLELNEDFKDCLNDSLTPQEFEAKWLAMIQRHGVEGNTDLAALYEKRNCWVPAYFMHNFYPFLQTTGRSEGFNAVLKKYVNPQNSVSDFVRQYAAIQEKYHNAEGKEEADTLITTATTWCSHPIEVQMEKIYTRSIYYRFQSEMQKLMSYNCQHIMGDIYSTVCIAKFVPHYGDRSYTVHANVGAEHYECECSKMDRDGMVCCHILKVQNKKDFKSSLPYFVN